MNEFDVARGEYIQKLGKQIDCIGSVLRECGIVLDEIHRKDLSKLKEDAEFLKGKLERDEFEIAIVGLEKAGKSTFANALIESDLLPTKQERCTYTSTCVTYGEQAQLEISFFSEGEFNNSFRENLSMLCVENVEKYEYNTLSPEMLDTLLGDRQLSMDQINVKKDLCNIWNHKETIRKLLGSSEKSFSGSAVNEKLDKYIVDKENALAVKRVNIRSDKLAAMKNAVMYDVPGFDSPTKIHEEQTIKRMKSADAITLIANAEKPSLTGPQLKIFKEDADSDGVKYKDKLFVYANRVDLAEDWRENKKILLYDLHNESILEKANDERVVLGSASAYLHECELLQTKLSQQAFDNLKEMGIPAGIKEIRYMLEQYNRDVRFTVLKRRVDKISYDIGEIYDNLKIRFGSNESFDSKILKRTLDVFNNAGEDFENYVLIWTGF